MGALAATAGAVGLGAGFWQRSSRQRWDAADLRIWLCGDAHLKQSVDVLNYNCLETAIRDMDTIGFDYDLVLNVGDFDSAHLPPTKDGNDEEGKLVVDALTSSPNHDRAEFYCINGNHDAGDGEMDWFEKYIDVLGENPEFSKHDLSKRPYPITLIEDGAWHSYYVEIGNLMVFMLSDRNSGPAPYGREGLVDGSGGYPSGAISKKTWEWFKAQVLANQDKNIFVCTHQGVRNTVIATGDNEGEGFHGGTSGIPEGRGCVYTILDEDNPDQSISGTDIIKDFFAEHPEHTVRLWMNGHTHSPVGSTRNGRGITHQEHGVQFLNICSLTSTWIGPMIGPIESRSWTCAISGQDVNLRCFVHLPIQEHISKGFQDELELTVKLAHPFKAG
ncbi:metallophosphoesterase [Roseovarius sp. MMSF_3305]|uniref:metallophosphoesterase family protein n=1 Tax=Roseovarius sp. MMSF_3305 TaxID=3046697 RepID=UPI00273F9577|nr:metallophosphoesterase [Roseovarius sp. MMSF_3305]